MNYLPGKSYAAIPGAQQAAHAADLDGSPVRVALTREP